MEINNLSMNLPEERGWEYKQVSVTRVPGFGFGIAVSGGRDNPHFASGDPSIAVSDVLAAGPAERLLLVNDRIISVNGISLQNVDYSTAVQVLRDSGDTVLLVIKRRTLQLAHGHSASYSGPPPLAALGVTAPTQTKVMLTKNSKKEDFGIVLGCKLFIKDISSKTRDQLINTNQSLDIGSFVTKINNTNCNDLMSLKDAKKIIDSCKDKLYITIARDSVGSSAISHQTQSSFSSTGAVNNFYKGDDFLMSSNQSYSNQNLYVQPPTRNNNLNINGLSYDEKSDPLLGGSGPNSLNDEKSNLAPRGRARVNLSEPNVNQLANRNSISGYGRSKGNIEEPPRPPPPRTEDYYSSRRLMYEDDPIVQKNKQPIPDARFITFHKEGSVGIKLTGGNFAGIFVTAVQPGSPASLQGLQPGDKILKVNDMDMSGVTREDAVQFLLSLQDRIELIVQFCKEEYDSTVALQKGDSFYIKTHFHFENSVKGEMVFRSGDIFHVVDTLFNGAVGCWQVFRIGRNNQEVQKGIIPNKSRAEELATAQFNATKKEMSANESRGGFFKRRRSSNRRSKSLGKEHWDDILFSDTISKFAAYERVILKHPGFTRPVILFGPIADIAREKLLKDFPDKFISPQLDSTPNENSKSPKPISNIIRLSAIREVIATGRHALLDITPNAVERLNYAQLYPIVVFFKTETKMVIKQLRHGLPKTAHKSSKKLLEQCQKLEKVWDHIFSATINLTDNSDTWYRKVREVIDKQQSGTLWMSETQPEESLSDDFLFPMSSLRLSYASSPESDLEHSPGPPTSLKTSTPNGTSVGGGVGGRLTKASSDPSVVVPLESGASDTLPPYQPTYDTHYGFGNNNQNNSQQNSMDVLPDSPLTKDPSHTLSNPDIASMNPPEYNATDIYSSNIYQQGNPYKPSVEYNSNNNTNSMGDYNSSDRREFNSGDRIMHHKRQSSNLHGSYNHAPSYSLGNEQSMLTNSPTIKESIYGPAPDLPPRVDRAVKPMGLLTTTPNKVANGRSAHERLFGSKSNALDDTTATTTTTGLENGGFNDNNKGNSLERSQNSKSDSLSSYDSYNKQVQAATRIGPNLHDDLKTTLSKIDPTHHPSSPLRNSRWNEQQQNHQKTSGSKMDLKYGLPPGDPIDENPRNSREVMDNNRDDNGGLVSENLSPRESIDRDIYKYGRTPTKQHGPGKMHMETKTDYNKYGSRNSSSNFMPSPHHQPPPEYTKSISQEFRDSQFGMHQHSPMRNPPHNGYEMPPPNNGMPMNGNQYKPIPPPKPKNYKPPQVQGGGYPRNDGLVQTAPIYQHGKSHSNPVDPRSNQNPHNYYYNSPPMQLPPPPHHATPYYPDRLPQMVGGHYDMAPPYHMESPRRHPSISYASRSEIQPIATSHDYGPLPPSINEHRMDNLGGGGGGGGIGVDGNGGELRPPPVVDLQRSREKGGSAFELYRKPIGHNLRSILEQHKAFYGSQPNIVQNLNASTANSCSTTNHSPKVKTKKLTKAQSFKHPNTKNDGGFSTSKLFRKWSFGRKHNNNNNNDSINSSGSCSGTPKMSKRLSLHTECFNEDQVIKDLNRNSTPNKRDITSAFVDHRGATLVNDYWGVTLVIPEGALKMGEEKEIYFVISDPRLSENAPPLDIDKGETMLSPLVMCGPQGIEFQKPVILNIPHYANTLPSLGISLKATDSEQDIHTDWDNILLPSNHTANSVAVKVDHF